MFEYMKNFVNIGVIIIFSKYYSVYSVVNIPTLNVNTAPLSPPAPRRRRP